MTPGEQRRAVEAMLFAATEPLTEAALAALLCDDGKPTSLLRDDGRVKPTSLLCDVDGKAKPTSIAATLAELQADYAGRGIELVRRGSCWHFQTAPDLAHLLRRDRDELRKLSRAGIETLAIIAYHEPVTRAEIEAVRGVQISKGTLDVLLEAGWIRPAGRRDAPGRPLQYATTPGFLSHFGLASRRDLPGLDDLKAAGLLDGLHDAASAPADEGAHAQR